MATAEEARLAELEFRVHALTMILKEGELPSGTTIMRLISEAKESTLDRMDLLPSTTAEIVKDFQLLLLR